jgi:5-(carboxyamino)imidazole ribonucleotide mutase
MTRHAILPVLLTALVSVSVVAVGQSPRPAARGSAGFDTAVQPFLATQCYGCHNQKLSSGTLDLTQFKKAGSIAEHRDRWELVLKRVKAGEMPPPPLPRPKAAEGRGLEVIIAGAGGAAHLPGMVAALSVLPVLGVPVESHALKGMDSLLSIVQMPGGVPVGTLAIGKAGATNAGLLAVAILANRRPELREALHRFRQEQARKVRESSLR